MNRPPDPKPQKRVRDPELLKRLHLEWRDCALSLEGLDHCLGTRGRLSLHHIHRHPRNDVRGNLVMLCGDGTTGCHGAIEARDEPTLRALGMVLRVYRPDVFAYLSAHLGGAVAAQEWLARHLWRD